MKKTIGILGGMGPLATADLFRKIVENRSVKDKDAEDTAAIVGLSAIKYGDLSNQASKDYIFDTDKFTSFEGNTGPYILYTIVRIKSILARFVQDGGDLSGCRLQVCASESEKALELVLTRFAEAVSSSASDLAPHKLCAYIYELANAFNHFYHETKILTHPDQAQKESWIALLDITRRVLETSIDLLGFEAPERM